MTDQSRRQLLIDRMKALEAEGLDCRTCSGTCCTFEANSMMVTPLEALELLSYLKKNNLLDEVLKDKCSLAVKKYRLDHQVGNGKRSYLRRTYTCPFFGHQELGCPLPREIKPYGCLAFNSHHVEKKAGSECYSETQILEQRESAHAFEFSINKVLQEKYKIFWMKSPLPSALVDLWNLDFNDEDLLPS